MHEKYLAETTLKFLLFEFIDTNKEKVEKEFENEIENQDEDPNTV